MPRAVVSHPNFYYFCIRRLHFLPNPAEKAGDLVPKNGAFWPHPDEWRL